MCLTCARRRSARFAMVKSPSHGRQTESRTLTGRFPMHSNAMRAQSFFPFLPSAMFLSVVRVLRLPGPLRLSIVARIPPPSSFCATIHNREVPAHSKLMVHYLCLFCPSVRPSINPSSDFHAVHCYFGGVPSASPPPNAPAPRALPIVTPAAASRCFFPLILPWRLGALNSSHLSYYLVLLVCL
jgi:hypothetical protein